MTVPVFPMRKMMTFCVLMTLCVSAHAFQSNMYYVNNGNLYSYYGVRYNDAGLVVKDVVVRNGVLFWIESTGDASWLVMWTNYTKYYQSLDIPTPVSIEMNDYYVHVANDSTAGDIYRIQWTSDPHKGLTRYGAVAFDITNDYVVWFERDALYRRSIKGEGGITPLIYLPNCKAVAIQGNWVYYLQADPEHIGRVCLDGGETHTILTDAQIRGDATDIDTDATYVYYATPSGLYRCNFVGNDNHLAAYIYADKITIDGYKPPVRTFGRWADFRN